LKKHVFRKIIREEIIMQLMMIMDDFGDREVGYIQLRQ
jgi:hypothetical protein